MRKTQPISFVNSFVNELLNIPGKVKKIFESVDIIKTTARKLSKFENFLFIGRKYHYPTALEGALKLKEISYIHAEAYPAGEMKHGSIALIDKEFPTVALAFPGAVYEKMISNIQEIRARKGKIITVGEEQDRQIRDISEYTFHVPKTLEMISPILAIVPLQLLAFYIGTARGNDVDQPRNLAKSVTVE
jgi:glucosamine--fructose-6-phosphate aminotransferase (isomerizing)